MTKEVSTIPLPSVYVDEVMVGLTDTEWRVLCVIIRQTLGWHDPMNPGERKERDWISQSQFRLKTGKSRDSLSRAIAGLVALGLIQVETESGHPLASARERRLARQRLYYRLCPVAHSLYPVALSS